MAAKDYQLAVSELTGTVYITKVSKKDSNVMTDDRIEVTKNAFIPAILHWTKSQIKDGQNILTLTAGGKPIAEIKILAS